MMSEILQEREVQQASGYYATFAWMWNFGDKPICEYWILRGNESWGDAVRGDGHSYSPSLGGPLPGDMSPLPGETLEKFEERVREMADNAK